MFQSAADLAAEGSMPAWLVLVHDLGIGAISIGNKRIAGTSLQDVEHTGFCVALLDDNGLG